VADGDFVRPRAIAIDAQDRLFIVDFTARIQVYDRDGNYLHRTWSTPDYRKGRPSGLSIDRDGNLIVSDSHYNCFRIYSPEGEELRVLGGQAGPEPGQLGYVSDVVQDTEGFFYVAEFGENGRISKFDLDGKYVKCWGSPGSDEGQFARARALALGPDGNLYVADACNHRIQVFTRDGEQVRCWGTPGPGVGELNYPYDVAFNRRGELYVSEYGNQRVQKFTVEGVSLGCWGAGMPR
jgi:DNA-binding beta-propeller fold protein YncE